MRNSMKNIERQIYGEKLSNETLVTKMVESESYIKTQS